MRKVFALGLILTLAVISASCSASRKLPKRQIGSQQVVERIPSKTPKWIEVPFEENKRHLFFKGEASDVYDSALGLRQAKAHAVQNLIEAIRIKARSEFSEAIRGVNASERSIGQYLDSVVAWTTDNLPVTGIRPDAEYREKVLVNTAGGVEYRYNCFVRISISKEDYLHARKRAYEQALSVFQEEDARRLALEAKEKLDR